VRAAAQLEDLVAVVDTRVLEGDVLGARGNGAGGDEDDLGLQEAFGLARRQYADRVRIREAGVTVQVLDRVPGDVLRDHLAQRAHDLLLAIHEVLDRELVLDLGVDAVQRVLVESGEVERGLAQRLGGHGAGVGAGAAGIGLALDDGDPLAEVRGLGGAFFAGRSGADHDQVEAIHLNLPYDATPERYKFSRSGPSSPTTAARRCASGSARSGAMAGTPSDGPTARVANAQRQPTARRPAG
jgi:hypothetical protein